MGNLKVGLSNSAFTSNDWAQAQLDRALTSRAFAHSERLRRLLRYMIEKFIRSKPEQMKEYCLGVEVFGREPS